MISNAQLLCNAARLAMAWGDPYPTPEEQTRPIADRAVDGIISFYHTKHTRVGRVNIDWSAPQHAHQEWPAQLNRFYALSALAAAYRATGTECYAEAARDYIADWIRAHPTCAEWTIAPYDNTLNLSARVGGWLGVLPVFCTSSAFDTAFRGLIIDSVRAQLAFLRPRLTPFGNWRLAQATAFLLCGIRLDPLPDTAEWRRFGVNIINDAAHRQILPDGAHIERTPSYHGGETQRMTHLWRLGQVIPELGLAITAEAVARMHDYALASTLPHGVCNPLHDSGGPRDGQRDNTALRARAAFRADAGLPDALPPTTQFFPAAGQAFLRDSWASDAVCLTFDATTWGGGHCHRSRNGVQLHAYGRSLVVDPGILTYEVHDPAMAHGRSTRAHNTVNLNGWNQSQANPTGTVVRSVPGYDVVASCYEGGYWPGRYTWYVDQGYGQGVWGRHHRTLLWVRGRCAVVLDVMNTVGEHSCIESNWQLCEGPYALDAASRRAHTCHPDANALLLFPLVPEQTTLAAYEGQEEPRRGWLQSDYTGPGTPAAQIVLHSTCRDWCADFATVLIPFAGPDAPRVCATAHQVDGASELTLSWEDGTTDTVFWTRELSRMLGAMGDLDTDSALVHVTRDADGAVQRAFAFDATYLRPYDAHVRPAPEVIVVGG